MLTDAEGRSGRFCDLLLSWCSAGARTDSRLKTDYRFGRVAGTGPSRQWTEWTITNCQPTCSQQEGEVWDSSNFRLLDRIPGDQREPNLREVARVGDF